jgi:hypothetical protein
MVPSSGGARDERALDPGLLEDAEDARLGYSVQSGAL